MAVQLFGDPFNLQAGGGNLQGGSALLQGGSPGLQGGAAAPVQPAYNPAAPAPRPVAPRPAAPVRTFAPAPVAPAAPVVQPVQINPMYAQYVQTRPSRVKPGVLEYFNPANNMGFSNPNDVFNYIRTMTGQSITDLRQLEGAPYQTAEIGDLRAPYNPAAPLNPYQNLAEQAGYAGIGYDDYLSLLKSQNSLSRSEKDAIKQGLGIPDLEGEIFKPAPSTQKLYDDAYKTAGLSDLRKQIKTKLAEINTAQKAFTEKKGKVDENPWLSEASRVGRGRVLNEQAELRIGNLSNELSSLEKLYNAGVNEVNNLVTRQATDFSANQTLNTAKLNYLLTKAEQQIGDKASEKLTEAYSYLPAYLQAKARSQKPDTIGSESTGYYRWNQQTGTFEQVIGPADKSLDNAYKLAQIQKLQQEISSGGLNDLDRQYKQAQLQKLQQEIANPNLGKPPTEGQSSAAAYAMRVRQANDILKNLESSIKNYNKAGFEAQIRLPNNMQSGTIQSYNQAARGFINALLRRESGAAIADSEFNRYVQQYIPQPGDTAQTLAQKAADRNAALQGLINSAGSAYGGGGQGGFNPADPLGIRFNSAGNASASIDGYAKRIGNGKIVTGSPHHHGPERDIDGKIGDPIAAFKGGTVIEISDSGKSGYGKKLVVQDAQGNRIIYGHLHSFNVTRGQQIAPGQILGTMGNSGNVIAGRGGDGSHLHIEQRDRNNKLIPLA